MIHIEARKPIENAGIRREVDRQQEKMKELFNELKEKLSKNKAWDEKPKDFFKLLGKKLREAGIDEKSFADFIVNEVEIAFKLTFRQAAKTEADKYDWSKAFGTVSEKELSAKFRLASIDEDVGTELLTVAYCLRDAAAKRVGVAEYSEKYAGQEEVQGNRELAQSYVHSLKNRERQDASDKKKGGEESHPF
ncbi:MAG: hypothetical protein QXF56_05600 [Candidatus Micrarchaeia archaeon]